MTIFEGFRGVIFEGFRGVIRGGGKMRCLRLELCSWDPERQLEKFRFDYDQSFVHNEAKTSAIIQSENEYCAIMR